MRSLKFIIKALVVLSIIGLVNVCTISYGQVLSTDINIDNKPYILDILVSADIQEKFIPQDIIPTKDMMIKPKLAEANSDPSKEDMKIKYFRKNDVVKVEISSVDNGYSNIIINNERYAIKTKYLKPVESIEVQHNEKMQYVGKFKLTAYAWTGNRCANGKYPTLNKTVAAHKLDFPMGTKLYIDGYGYYTVEDRGGFNKGVIDIYLADHDTCVKFGRKHDVDVYIIK